jgi:hypothetical protein
MNNYLILLIAFILGQFLYTAITVYHLQKDKDISYVPAFKAYVKKEAGGYLVAILGLFVVMFILSDFIDINTQRKDLPEVLTIKQKMIFYFRTSATIFGVFAQHIIFVAFKKGKRAIEKEDAKIDA